MRVTMSSKTLSRFQRLSLAIALGTAGALMQQGKASAQAYSYFSDSTVVREQSDSKVYTIMGGAKLWIHDPTQLCTYYGCWSAVQTVPDGTLTDVPTIPRDGTLLTAEGSVEVFVMEGGQRKWVPDPTTFECRHHDWALVRRIGPAELADIPRGVNVAPQLAADFAGEVDPQHPANHYMSTRACLDTGSGHIEATTRTATFTAFGGYHGAVILLVKDAHGHVIGASGAHRFGVDGYFIGRSDRTDVWSDDVNPSNIAGISIVHSRAPANLISIVNQAVSAAKPIVDLIASLYGIGSGK